MKRIASILLILAVLPLLHLQLPTASTQASGDFGFQIQSRDWSTGDLIGGSCFETAWVWADLGPQEAVQTCDQSVQDVDQRVGVVTRFFDATWPSGSIGAVATLTESPDGYRLVDPSSGTSWSDSFDSETPTIVESTFSFEPLQESNSNTTSPGTFSKMGYDGYDERCQSLAGQADVMGLPPNAVTTLGCRQTGDGTWILPRFPEDSRISESGRFVLPPTIEDRAEPLRAEILRQLDEFIDYWTPSWLRDYILNAVDPVTGRLTFQGANPQSFLYDYEGAIGSYLLDPNHQELADYVFWYVSRRDAVLGYCPNLAPLWCIAFQRQWDYQRAPWPQLLQYSETLDLYLSYQYQQ